MESGTCRFGKSQQEPPPRVREDFGKCHRRLLEDRIAAPPTMPSLNVAAARVPGAFHVHLFGL